MNTILIAILLLTDIIKYFIFADIILSWLTLFWPNIRPAFIGDIINPVYKKIRSIIPTTFWPIDFTPIVILIILIFIKWIIMSISPWIENFY